ncbi:Down syndrome cell adhesion molecule-like protein Dscam2 [Eumeta japonica]|uniref:Hemolin n=1 Tax=Eumeta variegata TaxID=151549 RepID=A0A4C1SCV1_EUMVA|nr:Down syndrome cell adhesion molecule-like protein Dscam2 [Eumeta japonica]
MEMRQSRRSVGREERSARRRQFIFMRGSALPHGREADKSSGRRHRVPPAGSMAPRLTTTTSEETVQQGADIRLVCCAIGHPAPTYSWFRHNNGRLMSVSNSIRISVAEQVLVVRRAQLSDNGLWACRAHNQHGEQRRDLKLTVTTGLTVRVNPPLQLTQLTLAYSLVGNQPMPSNDN